jgi:DNA-binding NarL/FixJ family response regulator
MNLKKDLTKAECVKLREECNFTDEERAVFDLRVTARSVIQIADTLHMSEATVYRRLRNIKRKILKVL